MIRWFAIDGGVLVIPLDSCLDL
eukprot:SAG11_NODE_51633_length_109_cov_59.400000_1_plen_22_part_10